MLIDPQLILDVPDIEFTPPVRFGTVHYVTFPGHFVYTHPPGLDLTWDQSGDLCDVGYQAYLHGWSAAVTAHILGRSKEWISRAFHAWDIPLGWAAGIPLNDNGTWLVRTHDETHSQKFRYLTWDDGPCL